MHKLRLNALHAQLPRYFSDGKHLRPRLIFFDLETTGLNKRRDKVTEIALWDPQNNVHLCSLINPEVIIPSQVVKLNGITNEM
jgi:DNA polymerase III epsilon subunit-like protein